MLGSSVCASFCIFSKGVSSKSPITITTKKYHSSAFDFRRNAARRQWRVPPPEDTDMFSFPNERLGNQYDVNWSLCKDQVIPVNNAFRNLHIRGLQMLSQSTTDANKTVQLSIKDPAQHPVFIVGEAGNINGTAIEENGFRFLLRDVRKHLSDSENIFMHDGAIGSDPSTSIKIRAISDSANTALYLRHSLHSTPLRNPRSFEADVTAFIVPDIPSNSLVGFSSPNFTVVDTQNNRIVIVGTPSFSSIEKSLLAFAGNYFFPKNVLSIASDVLLVDGKPVLVFSDSDSISSKSLQNVFSAGHSLWSETGLSRTFNSATISSTSKNLNLSRGDIVNTVGKNVSVIKQFTPQNGNSVPHPMAVVFVLNSKNADIPDISTVSVSQAKNLFKQFSKSTDDVAAIFESRLQGANVPVVLIKGAATDKTISTIQSLGKEMPKNALSNKLFDN